MTLFELTVLGGAMVPTFRWPVAVLLLMASAVPALAQGSGYETNFDNSTGWTFSGGSGGVGWAVDASPAGMPGGPAQTPANSLNYNNGINYASSSGANSGTATSPLISLAGLQTPTLTFWCNFQTEPGAEDANYPYDQRTMKIIPTGGSSVTATFGVTGASPLVGACSPMGTWHQHTVALQASWGNIHVSFKFDTVDGVLNTYGGWFIDTLEVSGSANNANDANAAAGTYKVHEWNFDAGMQGWTASPAVGGVAWAADATPASVAGASSFVSAPNSLNYNNGTDFNSGSASNNGTATSPPVSLGSLVKPLLVFQCNFQAETSAAYDKRFLQVLNSTGTVLEAQHLVSGAPSTIGNCSAPGTWHSHKVSLDPSWGTVRIRFKFDSVDGDINGGAGWFVDDVKILAACTAATPHAPVKVWNFDTATLAQDGWSVENTDSYVLWNADPSPAVVAGGASYFSAPNSLNYNNATNYLSAGYYANSGTATSPSIDLKNLECPRLVFQCNYKTRSSPTLDVRTVQISNDGFQKVLFQAQVRAAPGDPAIGPCSTPGQWHAHMVDLDPAWGTVQFRFKFNTVNAPNIEYPGWFVDDVTVEAVPAPVVAGSVETRGEDKSDGGGGKCGGSVAGVASKWTWIAPLLLLLVLAVGGIRQVRR